MPRRFPRTPAVVRRIAAAGLVLVAGSPVLAQSPADRARLEAVRAGLEGETDTLALRRLERGLGGRAGDAEAEALRLLRRSAVRLRLGALTDGHPLRAAIGDAERATHLAPAWPLAWSALGRAQIAAGDWLAADPLNLGDRVGFGRYEAAVRSFARATELDPSAAAELFAGASRLRDTAQYRTIVLPALRAGATAQPDTGILLALGRLERLTGDSARAVAAAREYLSRGGTPGLGLRELAWSLFLADEPGGDSVWYAGAAADDSASVAAYRDDLALIEPDSVMAEYDTLRGPARAGWLARRWADRARRDLREPADRLAEHYRRLTTAERRYGLPLNRRHHSDGDLYRSNSLRFDDRGAVYVRYGTPDGRAATVTYGLQPNETWLFHRVDGDLLLHFAANPGGSIGDYRLIPTILAIGGLDGAATDVGISAVLSERCALYPPYCKLSGWGPLKQVAEMERERRLGRVSAAIALSSDGDGLRFPREVDLHTAAFAVGTSGSGTLVHLVFDARLGRPAHDGPLRVRVSAADAAGHIGGWLDTTLAVDWRAAPWDTLALTGRVALPLPDGIWSLRAAVSLSDSVGRVVALDSVRVADFDGRALAVSDLLLADRARAAAWSPAPGDTAWFSSARSWRRGAPVALYFEVYGLTEGSGYTATLALRRGRRTVLQLTDYGTALGPVTRVARTLTFEAVKPGDYVMEVTVTAADGVREKSERSIIVLPDAD